MRDERDTLQRKRTAYAYDEVVRWRNVSWGKKAVSLVKGLPVALRSQGLTVVLMILMGSKEAERQSLAKLIATWLMEQAPVRAFDTSDSSFKDPVRLLLQAVVDADRSSYLSAQAEALALLEQTKMVAQALFTVDID